MNVLLVRRSVWVQSLGAVVLVGVLVLLAVTGTSALRSGLEVCRGADCEGGDVVVGSASGATPAPTTACLHDPGCGGGRTDTVPGFGLAALLGGVAVVVAVSARRAVRVADVGLRSRLFGQQLFRPPQVA